MSAATSIPRIPWGRAERCIETTLLELVAAVSDECESEAEVVATVLHLLGSGRARLCGSFRNASLRDLVRD
jgi:hypothetical protein